MPQRKLTSIRLTRKSAGADSSAGDPPAPPPERELRLALVCYGGVSLAVYMYGISREVLGLVRASERLHRRLRNPEAGDAADNLLASERVYLDILSRIAQRLRLRVIVDVLAGASAGGINAIMLARALAEDGALERHRDFWLRCADVGVLLDPKARAHPFSKVVLRPVVWLYGRYRRLVFRRKGRFQDDPEVWRKLSLFVRSRWFEPPFSGPKMCALMLDALAELQKSRDPDHSRPLIPKRLPLDLFVTATDFWGHPVPLALHDPPVVTEREHRRIFHFRRLEDEHGVVQDDLARGNDAGLAFAARATASFPGIFPAAHLGELDEVLDSRGKGWPARGRFIAAHFQDLIREGLKPEQSFFIDGSVLMNKPISIALKAIDDHAAHREVDRRLVYVEPLPAEASMGEEARPPGWLRVIRSALSEIPRKQPIRDDLEAVAELNAQLERVRRVASAVRPQVIRMVSEMLGPRMWPRPSAARLGRWRRDAHERAARDSTFAYEGYVRLKLRVVFDELIDHMAADAPESARKALRDALRGWGRKTGILVVENPVDESARGDDVRWIEFLRDFDLSFRLRRLRFIIRRINELYLEGGDTLESAGRRWLDQTKARLYQILEDHTKLLAPAHQDHGRLTRIAAAEGADVPIEQELAAIREHWRLVTRDEAFDEQMSACLGAAPTRHLARELLAAYLGFVYYDVATYPMMVGLARAELQPIKVDRIAVEDAESLHPGGARELLKGIEFQAFAGFFSEAYRENDYLWGRLTGAERLVDIVASAAPEAATEIDLVALKKQLFSAILDEEEPHLGHVGALIADLRRRIAAMGEPGEHPPGGPRPDGQGSSRNMPS